MRILPKINATLNGDWIPDKVRFNFDGFLKNMCMTPEMHRRFSKSTAHKFNPSWDFCFLTCQQLFNTPNLQVQHSFGSATSFDDIASIKFFFNRIGFEYFAPAQDGGSLSLPFFDFRNFYVCQLPLANVEQLATNAIILLINCNIKTTLPILETKIYQAFKTGCAIFVIGPAVPVTYKVTHLGTDLRVLQQIRQGKH